MGNEAITPPGFTITAVPLCTSASTGLESDSAPNFTPADPAQAQSSSTFSALPVVFSSPLQSLEKQIQRFGSAKDIFGTDGSEAIPVDTCSTVSFSGSGYFGDVEVGRSQTNSFTVSNPCACPVTVYLAGSPYGFSISTSSISLSANGSSSFTITFRPPSETSYSGSISSNPSGSISLSGRGYIRR